MHSSIGPSDFTRVLVLLLLPLSNASICRAVWPESPAPAAEASKLSDTVNDDLQIARVMAATFNYCDSTYNRYFRQRDSQLVRHLFQRIADFLLDTAINADNLEEAIVNQSKTGFMKSTPDCRYHTDSTRIDRINLTQILVRHIGGSHRWRMAMLRTV